MFITLHFHFFAFVTIFSHSDGNGKNLMRYLEELIKKESIRLTASVYAPHLQFQKEDSGC